MPAGPRNSGARPLRLRLVQKQGNGFARLIVNPVECLRRLVPRLGVEDIPQGLLSAVQCVAVVVVQPVVLKQALDFKQLGHDRVACHCRRVDDSPVARAIKTAPFPRYNSRESRTRESPLLSDWKQCVAGNSGNQDLVFTFSRALRGLKGTPKRVAIL